MSPTIRSLVVTVSDMDAVKKTYTALLGAPHTDQPYYVGYNSTASRSLWLRATPPVDRWPSPTSRISTRPAKPCSRPARPSATPRGRSLPELVCVSSPTPKATRLVCAAGSCHGGRDPDRGRLGPGHRQCWVSPWRGKYLALQ